VTALPKNFARLTLVASCLLSMTLAALGDTPVMTRHVILLDISGSLRTRGYATRTAWTPAIPQLIEKLSATDPVATKSDDQMIVCPFSDGVTDKKEGRFPLGPFQISEFASHIPEIPYPGSGATDMPLALEMGKRLSQENLPVGARSLIWLITDNENNMDSNQSDQQFYTTLRDSADYSHVMFFPLADPKVRPNDNLVMYLMALQGSSPEQSWKSSDIEKIAQAIKQKTSYDGVVFRPLYSSPEASALDFSKELLFEGRQHARVTQEGGTTVLHFKEGDKFDGQLKFKIRSRLKGWRLDQAHLDDAEVSLEIPPLYAKQAQAKSKWQVTPNQLTVLPQKETAEFFLLHLAGPSNQSMKLERTTGQQLASPFETSLPPIKGKVRMNARVDVSAEQIKADIPPELKERLTAVQGLSEIEHFMVQQQDGTTPGEAPRTTSQRDIKWERDLLIKVEADSTPALLLTALLAIVALAVAALAAAIFLFKNAFKLEGPGIEEELSLGYLWGKFLACDQNGQPLFWIYSKAGSLSLKPEPEMTLNTSTETTAVIWEGDEFRFECGPDGKPQDVFWLRRAARGSDAHESGGSPL
jgi:hypothetical protein